MSLAIPTSCAANCALSLNNAIYGVWSADPTAQAQVQQAALGTASVTSFTRPSGETGYIPAAQTNYNCDLNAFSSMFSNASNIAYNMGRNCGVTATLDARDQQMGVFTATHPTPFLIANEGVFSGVTPTKELLDLTACKKLTNANFLANPAATIIGQVLPQTTQMAGSSDTVYQAPGLVQMFPGNSLVSMCSNILLNSAAPRYMGAAAAIRAVTTSMPVPGQAQAAADPPAAAADSSSTDTTGTDTNTGTDTGSTTTPSTTSPSTTSPTTITTPTGPASPPPLTASENPTNVASNLNPQPAPVAPQAQTTSSQTPSTSSVAPPPAPQTSSSSSSSATPLPPPPAPSVTTSSSETPEVVQSVPPTEVSSPAPPVEAPTESEPVPMYTNAAAASRSDSWLLTGSLLGVLGVALCL